MMKSTFALLGKYYQLCLVLWAILVGLGLYFGGVRTEARWLLSAVALLLCIPLVRTQWLEFRSGRYGIDVLALAATITAVIIGKYWTAIALALVIVCNRILENYVKRRATKEFTELLDRAPQLAHVLRGRKIVDIAVVSVQKNYKLSIEPGEIVPVDAIILDGTSNFDESLLTGDHLPQKKTVQDIIISGSVNLDNTVKVKVISTAAHSQYEQVTKALRAAIGSSTRTPLAHKSEVYSIPFTVVAFGIAAAAWVLSGHVSRFLDVLVVGAVFPLLSAAPLAFISGVNLASRFGIFVKSGKTLEQLSRAKTIAFEPFASINRQTKANLVQLKELGIPNFVMIAEDDTAVTQKTAKQMDVTSVQIAPLPGDKLRVIENIADRPVAFIGYGEHDAPLITTAEVGIVLGAYAKPHAAEAATVVILASDLSYIAVATAIAKRTMRIARQSIAASIMVSVGLMILFAFGWLPPLFGVALQAAINLLTVWYVLRTHVSKPAV